MTETKPETIPFKIDGKDYTALPGETVLEAALRNGVFIPHYCWHPGLGVDGNCRMCLVNTKPGPPKPQIACNTRVSEGMEVDSSSAQVKEDREGVLEFLLINHPLDCPICDQAGECDLQQYSFDHGREESRFTEAKTQRPRKDLGPLIRYNGNRCIVCTRCTRFTEMVTGTGELCVVNRGDRSYIDVFPGIPLDNPLSGCVADLCPVGALLETDSIHATRVWLLRGTKSVCGGCATGCNINVETFDDQVQRLTPRENQAVNKWWMCDVGRLSHNETKAQDRLRVARIDGQEATNRAALDRILELASAAIKKGPLGGLTTGFATCEELFLLEAIVGKGPLGLVYRSEGDTFTARDGFSISADKNPNRGGVERVIGVIDSGEKVRAALASKHISLLLIIDELPGGGPWDAALVKEIANASVPVVAMTLNDGPLAAAATVALPGLHWTEKDGTWVNGRGRLQRLRAAVPPPSGARTSLDLLQELGRELGHYPRVVSAGGVFRRLSAAQPGSFGDVTYNLLGEVGLPLPGAADETPPDECTTYYEAGPTSRGPGRALDEQTRISVHRESPVGFGTLRGND